MRPFAVVEDGAIGKPEKERQPGQQRAEATTSSSDLADSSLAARCLISPDRATSPIGEALTTPGRDSDRFLAAPDSRTEPARGKRAMAQDWHPIPPSCASVDSRRNRRSTSSLPCAARRLPWVATVCGLACLRRCLGRRICRRLPRVAPAWLHKCSTVLQSSPLNAAIPNTCSAPAVRLITRSARLGQSVSAVAAGQPTASKTANGSR